MKQLVSSAVTIKVDIILASSEENVCLFQNLMALTAALGLPVPNPGVPLPAAGIKSEVAAEGVAGSTPVEVVKAEEVVEDGLANLAHAFFHLHCVHQRSRCSNP